MTEHQLSRLLHEQTPEPPGSIDLEELAARIQDPAAPARPRRRWLVPVTAAAAVVTVVAGVVALNRDSGSAPTTTSLPVTTGGTPTAGGTYSTIGPPQPATAKTAEPALAWTRRVVQQWEQKTAGDPFVPVGDWSFQRLGEVTAQERPYAAALDARRVVLGITVAPASVPPGVVRWDDGTTRAVGVQTADQTFLQLLHSGTLCTSCPATAESGGQTLSVTAAALTTMRIQTTRGEATVPAWRFSFAGTRLQALQAAVSARGTTPVMSTTGRPDDVVAAKRAELAPDGVTLTVHLNGAGSPASMVCGADYTGYAVESDRTVGILVIQHRNPTPVPCPLSGIPTDRTVTITLSTPLKDRTLLDPVTATPIPVTRH